MLVLNHEERPRVRTPLVPDTTDVDHRGPNKRHKHPALVVLRRFSCGLSEPAEDLGPRLVLRLVLVYLQMWLDN